MSVLIVAATAAAMPRPVGEREPVLAGLAAAPGRHEAPWLDAAPVGAQASDADQVVRVQGRIRDQAGAAVGGAEIRLAVEKAVGDWTPWRPVANSGADGEFALGVSESVSRFALQVLANGHATHVQGVDFRGDLPPAGLDIRLLPRQVLAGRVVDPTGAGLPGAKVRLVRLEPIAGADFAPAVSPPECSTDVGGEFSFGDVAPGRHAVVVTHPDHAPNLLECAVAGVSASRIEVPVSSGVDVRGRVEPPPVRGGLRLQVVARVARAGSDSSPERFGTAVPRDAIRFQWDSAWSSSLHGTPRPPSSLTPVPEALLSAEVADNGEFVLRGVPASTSADLDTRLVVFASDAVARDGSCMPCSDSVRWHAGRSSGAALVLPRFPESPARERRVVDQAGMPVVGATAECHFGMLAARSGSHWPSVPHYTLARKSVEGGALTLPGGGDAVVAATGLGQVHLRDSSDGEDAQLRAANLEVTVLRRDGLPLRHARIRLLEREGTGSSRSESVQGDFWTSAEGVVSLSVPATCALQVDADGFAGEYREVATTSRAERFALSRLRATEISLDGGEPTALAGCAVVIGDVWGPQRNEIARVTTGPDGKVRFELRESEAIAVALLDASGSKRVLELVFDAETSVYGRARRVQFPTQPERLVAIGGRVVDAQGRPLVGIRARLLANQHADHDIAAPTFSDTDGRFDLTTLPRDRYVLAVETTGEFVYRELSGLGAGDRCDLLVRGTRINDASRRLGEDFERRLEQLIQKSK